MRMKLVIGLAAMIGMTSGAWAQGLYWESTISGPAIASRNQQTYAVAKMIKLVDGSGHIVLVRQDQDKVVTIDTEKKTYTEISLGDLEKTVQGGSKQVQAAMAQMQDKLKDMPPEQRAMVEKMMKGTGVGADPPEPMVVTKTTETKTIGGYSCTKYEGKAGGKTELVVWATPDIKGFAALRDDYSKLQERMARMAHGAGASPAQAFAQIDGFPMETEHGDTKTVVTKIESRSIPASEFEIPAGYEKKAMPAMPGMH